MSRRVHKLDPALTASMGYADKRSYRTIHGKEFLFGEDKTRRRSEIYALADGRCEYCGRYTGWQYGEWHHNPPLSKGGDDSLAGGKWADRQCHKERHPQVRWSRAGAEAR